VAAGRPGGVGAGAGEPHDGLSSPLSGTADIHPVLSEDYAVKITRNWNVPGSGAGYVARFEVLKSFIDGYRIEEAGGRAHREYWIPAADMDALNAAIVATIELVAAFGEGTDPKKGGPEGPPL
jgi:hypothetical protein